MAGNPKPYPKPKLTSLAAEFSVLPLSIARGVRVCWLHHDTKSTYAVIGPDPIIKLVIRFGHAN